jgi:hypothetical protein
MESKQGPAIPLDCCSGACRGYLPEKLVDTGDQEETELCTKSLTGPDSSHKTLMGLQSGEG